MQRSLPKSARRASSPVSFIALVAMLGLSACGGGGGGNPAPPASPATPPAQPPPPANRAPTVSAGADQTIQLPANTIDLAGTADDADNDILSYTWTSDPAEGVSFSNPAAAATQVSFAQAGTYTLTLTASDGTASGSDSLVVTVQAADPPPMTEVWPGVDDEADPNHGWVAVAPTDVNMDPARLQEAASYSLTGGGSGLVSRYGRLVYKWGDIDARVDLKSTTKSMASIALGRAVDQGLIALEDTAQSHYADFGVDPTDPTPSDPAVLSQITVLQLATHTAGYDKPGDARVDLLYAPGTTWSYSDGGLNWLADTLTNVFQRDLSQLLTEQAWRLMHITTDDLQWRVPSGPNVRPPIGTLQAREFSSGIVANPNAMARIGLLFLRKGMWNGTRILSESFVAAVSTPHPQTASATVADATAFPNANLNYGLMWWTNAGRQLAEVPADAYWAWGLGDSLIVVIPSLDLVVARVGTNPDDPAGPHWRTGADGRARWDGNYEILRPFLTPIVQSVNEPAP